MGAMFAVATAIAAAPLKGAAAAKVKIVPGRKLVLRVPTQPGSIAALLRSMGKMMNRIAAAISLLVATAPVLAVAKDRFMEFDSINSTTVFDLSTVHILQPGKFSVTYTSTDHPDVMRLRLAILDEFKAVCGKPAGRYAMGQKVLAMKQADVAVEDIVVEAGKDKMVTWSKPWYENSSVNGKGQTVQDSEFAVCTDKFFRDSRQVIMDGLKSKIQFDCKRAVMGLYFGSDSEPMMVDVRGGYTTYYKGVCKAVTGLDAYRP